MNGVLEVLHQTPPQEEDVGVALRTELAQDGGPTHPEVVIDGPRADEFRDLLEVRPEDRADPVTGDLVDHVPPGAGLDEAAIQVEGAGVLERPVVAVPAKRERG